MPPPGASPIPGCVADAVPTPPGSSASIPIDSLPGEGTLEKCMLPPLSRQRYTSSACATEPASTSAVTPTTQPTNRIPGLPAGPISGADLPQCTGSRVLEHDALTFH